MEGVSVIDTDVFIIDLRYTEDEKFVDNKAFLNLPISKVTTVFNLLEVCGIMSFNLKGKDLEELYESFLELYSLDIVMPLIPDNELAAKFMEELIGSVFSVIKRKIAFLDSLIIKTIEEYDFDYFVTWNTKHFRDKTQIEVFTPRDILREYNQSKEE